ncbi:MAG: sigma-70 family RNA polymerase sigma factor [Myxococcota bacterium]
MANSQALQRQRYAEVLEAHGPGLARVVGAYARRPEDREDLRQEFALALWKALPRYGEEASLKTFAYRIATNLSISHLRRRRPAEAVGEPVGEPPDRTPSPEAALEKADEGLRLRRAIEQLPLSLRQVVTLRLENLSYAEIGKVLGLTQKNVSVRLTRARKRLRRSIEEAP